MNRAYLSFLCFFVALLAAGSAFDGGPVRPLLGLRSAIKVPLNTFSVPLVDF
jgi:hypothetical protein